MEFSAQKKRKSKTNLLQSGFKLPKDDERLKRSQRQSERSDGRYLVDSIGLLENKSEKLQETRQPDKDLPRLSSRETQKEK